jgi:hypothetical protein
VASPMPLLAPVMSATVPSSDVDIGWGVLSVEFCSSFRLPGR